MLVNTAGSMFRQDHQALVRSSVNVVVFGL